MGSGDWFKTIISSKKVKNGGSKRAKGSSASAKSTGFKWKNGQQKESATLKNDCLRVNTRVPDMPIEDLAAIRIQTAFRAYMARKTLRRLKGTVRLQIVAKNYSVKKQSANALHHLHSWSKMQSQIRVRRLGMVTEGRSRQKKLENQLKLEAKLHDIEVGWCGGTETMEEVLARVHQREEAAVKRERAMAYAFSHQWRANSCNLSPVDYKLGKANWGWSWKERWITARPWESRVPSQSGSPKKAQNKLTSSKVGKATTKSPAAKKPVSSKPSPTNGKGSSKPRRLSYPAAEKQCTPEKATEANCTAEKLVS